MEAATQTNTRTNGRADAQENLLDKVIENGALLTALEEREKRNNSRKALKKQFEEAHEKVKGILATLDLETDQTYRVGQFRITKSSVDGRSVSFSTDPTERLNISLIED
jgi:hypothetical protein